MRMQMIKVQKLYKIDDKVEMNVIKLQPTKRKTSLRC